MTPGGSNQGNEAGKQQHEGEMQEVERPPLEGRGPSRIKALENIVGKKPAMKDEKHKKASDTNPKDDRWVKR